MPSAPLSQKIHTLAWSPDWQGRRLGEILRLALPQLASRARFMLVANGLVRCGGDVMRDLDAMVPEGAALSIDLRQGLRGAKPSKRPRLVDQIRVLHDDDDVVVVSKAAGIVVQPSDDEKSGHQPPVVELLKHYWTTQKLPIVNPTLVQRLDKETSGLFVLAKNLPAARFLQRQAAGHFMERRYIALVEGRIAEDAGTWDSHLGIGEGNLRQSMPPGPGQQPGSHAITHFRVLERFADTTLLECRLETGRTHQIRIHCAEAGIPVAGDRVYCRLARLRNLRGSYGHPAPRMMLHAARLKFQHPNGRWMSFRDDPPTVFEEFVAACREGRAALNPPAEPKRSAKRPAKRGAARPTGFTPRSEKTDATRPDNSAPRAESSRSRSGKPAPRSDKAASRPDRPAPRADKSAHRSTGSKPQQSAPPPARQRPASKPAKKSSTRSLRSARPEPESPQRPAPDSRPSSKRSSSKRSTSYSRPPSKRPGAGPRSAAKDRSTGPARPSARPAGKGRPGTSGKRSGKPAPSGKRSGRPASPGKSSGKPAPSRGPRRSSKPRPKR